MKKYFTTEEANSLIPKIEKIFIDIIKINKALALINSVSVDYEDELKAIKNDISISKNYHKLNYNLFKRMEDLTNMGCIVKDIDQGLVDFYSLLDDREIFLCWKLGEKEIKFWHEIDSGYLGRKPISKLKNI